MGLLPRPADLPLLPRPAALLQLLMARPDATIDDYVRVVGSDPALTSQVLCLANSALNRGFEPVVSTHAAVVRLGTDTTRRTVATMAVRSVFGTFEEAGLDTQALWWHLLGTGLLAEAMSADREQGHAAFTAGLLHDLGRLSLASLDPARYRSVVARVRAGQDVRGAERDEFGVSHISWGDQLAHHWRLPRALTEAIASHHDGVTGLAGHVARAREMLATLGFGDGVSVPAAAFEGVGGGAPPPAVPLLGGRDGLTARLAQLAADF